jgi:uncharacterized protein
MPLASLPQFISLPQLVAHAFTHPPRRPRFQTPRTLLGLPYTKFRVQTSDDIALSGWVILPQQPPKGLVVLSHGYTSCRETMLPNAQFLVEAGYATVLYDFRAHGWSGESLVTFGYHEANDLTAVLNWVTTHETLAPLPLFLLGESMGAAVSLFVAAQNPTVRAVIADSSYARFDNVLLSRFAMFVGPSVAKRITPPIEASGRAMLGIPLREIAPLLAIENIAPRPLFIIHGKKDQLIPMGNALKLYATAQKHYQDQPQNLQLWLVENAAHARNNNTAGDLYGERVLDFLNNNLPNNLLGE